MVSERNLTVAYIRVLGSGLVAYTPSESMPAARTERHSRPAEHQ